MIEDLASGAWHAMRLCFTVLPPMLAGCLAGSLFANSRLGIRCCTVFSPLARLTGLRGPSALYFPLCFLSFHSANAYLSSLLRKEIVEERDILGIYLVGWLPASLHFYIFFTAPALFPGIGTIPACIVLALYILASILIFCAGIVLVRRRNRRADLETIQATPASAFPRWPGLPAALKDGAMQFWGIASVFVPCLLVVEMLLSLPVVRTGMDQAGGLFAGAGVSPSAALVVAAALPSVMGGFATAIAFLGDSLITVGQLPKILMIAALGHALFSAFSYFLPANVAVFGPGLGTRLTFQSLVIRLPCLLTALAIASVIE